MGNWRIFESIWLSMLSQFDSQCWINLTLNVESIWLSMLSQFDSQCESIWLSMLSQFDSQCESIWLSRLSQFDSNRARAHWPLCLATGGRVFVAGIFIPVGYHYFQALASTLQFVAQVCDMLWLVPATDRAFAYITYMSPPHVALVCSGPPQKRGHLWLNKVASVLGPYILQLPTLPSRIIVPTVTQLFRSKWLNFLSQWYIIACRHDYSGLDDSTPQVINQDFGFSI